MPEATPHREKSRLWQRTSYGYAALSTVDETAPPASEDEASINHSIAATELRRLNYAVVFNTVSKQPEFKDDETYEANESILNAITRFSVTKKGAA